LNRRPVEVNHFFDCRDIKYFQLLWLAKGRKEVFANALAQAVDFGNVYVVHLDLNFSSTVFVQSLE
jgi:hypothetical protein